MAVPTLAHETPERITETGQLRSCGASYRRRSSRGQRISTADRGLPSRVSEANAQDRSKEERARSPRTGESRRGSQEPTRAGVRHRLAFDLQPTSLHNYFPIPAKSGDIRGKTRAFSFSRLPSGYPQGAEPELTGQSRRSQGCSGGESIGSPTRWSPQIVGAFDPGAFSEGEPLYVVTPERNLLRRGIPKPKAHNVSSYPLSASANDSCLVPQTPSTKGA